MNNPYIAVQHLSKHFFVKQPTGLWRDLLLPSFQKITALNNVNLQIMAGESVAILGPNGAGKTTLMKIISGILHSSTGKVRVAGFAPYHRQPDYLRSIGFVMGGKSGLYWDLTARQSFSLLQKIYRIPPDTWHANIEQLSDMLQIKSLFDTQIRQMSLGERMKVQLMSALLHQPRLLLLDEPTIGLDMVAKRDVRRFLSGLVMKKKITVLLTSHDVSDVEHIAQRAIVVQAGEITFDDTLEALTEPIQTHRVIRLQTTLERTTLPIQVDGFLIRQILPQQFEIYTESEQVDRVLSKLKNIKDIQQVTVQSPGLEDVLTRLFERSV